MRIEIAARRFAETEEEFSGWMTHLHSLANAYDEFLLGRALLLTSIATENKR